MKAIMFFAALVIGCSFLPPVKASAPEPRPRFELVLSEDAPTAEVAHFVVYHDKETLQEVVCYEHKTSYGGHAPACWLTGRKW